jgi:ribosomal protein S18
MNQEETKKNLNHLLYLKKKSINYKNIKLLKLFMNPFGEILSRYNTLTYAYQQRKISKAIKKAKAFKLIPNSFNFID